MMLLTLSPVFAVTEEEGCAHLYAERKIDWLYNQRVGGPCYWEIYTIRADYYACIACHEHLWTVDEDWYLTDTEEEHLIYQSSAMLFCHNCDWSDWAKK